MTSLYVLSPLRGSDWVKGGPNTQGFSEYNNIKCVSGEQFRCFYTVCKPKHELFGDENASPKYEY